MKSVETCLYARISIVVTGITKFLKLSCVLTEEYNCVYLSAFVCYLRIPMKDNMTKLTFSSFWYSCPICCSMPLTLDGLDQFHVHLAYLSESAGDWAIMGKCEHTYNSASTN